MISERQKSDYINLVIGKVRRDISAYETEEPKLSNINLLFRKIMTPGDRNKDFYILSHTKEFRKMGKYLLYISKKIDDNQISFENLIRNVTADADFIRKEVISYMSNPALKQPVEFAEEEDYEQRQNEKDISLNRPQTMPAEENKVEPEVTLYEDDDESSPANIYMRLIQSDEHSGEKAFELPDVSEESHDQQSMFTDHKEKIVEEDDAVFELPDEQNLSAEEVSETIEDRVEEDEEHVTEETTPLTNEVEAEGSFIIKKKLTFGFDEDEGELILGERVNPEIVHDTQEIPGDFNNENAEQANDRIALSDEFSEEIDEYIKQAETEPLESEDDDQLANAEFLEYEREVRICNSYLDDELTKFSEGQLGDGEARQRSAIAIIEAAQLLEERSRHMSFELISNIYQSISLSFEKIIDGKYDISESTVLLLKQGLELIESLIRGEDYFLYKAALKSIENIRKNLTEEKKKREEYSARVRAKDEIQRELNTKYPLKEQRQIVNNVLSNIRNIESIFRSTDYADGEFHTYEALKILSGSLINFKNIVAFSKELDLQVLAKLSEAGYNFVKYLCNYRKDPATTENKEIFEYLVYSQKSLLLGRHVDDTEVFISYLNDPIKIFSKLKDNQTNSQTR